jgi:hypothetical protein
MMEQKEMVHLFLKYYGDESKYRPPMHKTLHVPNIHISLSTTSLAYVDVHYSLVSPPKQIARKAF